MRRSPQGPQGDQPRRDRPDAPVALSAPGLARSRGARAPGGGDHHVTIALGRGRRLPAPVAPSRSLLLVAVAALLSACAREPAGPPNVVLVTLDTTRRDHCSLYGYDRATTPRLQELAAGGVVFDLAYAPSSSTAPSHATLLTGLYPVAHGVIRNGILLEDTHETLAERLRARGWQTAAFVSSFVLARSLGWAQGFDVFDDEFPVASATVRRSPPGGKPYGADRRADETTRRAVRWLEETRDPRRPFLLFVHYFDPHDPYVPPAAFAGRFPPAQATGLARIVSRYDEEIAFTDDQLGRLLAVLDRLDLADATIVVVTADHGEGLGQHNLDLHGVNIYEELVRAPLVVRWPGRVPAGRRLGAPVEQVDLVPSLLDLLALPRTDELQGRSLAAALLGDGALDADRPVFLHRRLYSGQELASRGVRGQKFGIRLGQWKYIEGAEEGTRELFDLEHDPGELRNLYEAEPARAGALAELLASWRNARGRPARAPAAGDDDTRERLRALGYVE